MTRGRTMIAALILSAACGGGGGGDDGGGDDDGVDAAAVGDGGGDEPDVPPVMACLPSCEVAADCATGPAGSIVDADNYACDDGVCRWLGCLSTAECTATFNDPDYACETAFGGLQPSCWPTCATAADCAIPQSPLYDADNYACDGGKCRWTGCNSTDECTAVLQGGNWTCATLDGATFASCLPTCATAADCAQETAPYDADNYACDDGVCVWTGCNSTAECMAVNADWVCQ